MFRSVLVMIDLPAGVHTNLIDNPGSAAASSKESWEPCWSNTDENSDQSNHEERFFWSWYVVNLNCSPRSLTPIVKFFANSKPGHILKLNKHIVLHFIKVKGGIFYALINL